MVESWGNAMADVFISYAKADADPTIALARDLEASGLSVWWDTSLLPDKRDRDYGINVLARRNFTLPL
jgi:hypothetical protein